MQSGLLLRGEKVDPRRENGLNGIRDGGLSRHEPFVPPIAMECASLNQRSEQFLEKERVALRSAEQVADRRGSLGRHELFEPPVDVSGGERLEPDPLARYTPSPPGWAPVEELRTRGYEQQDRRVNFEQRTLEQLEEWLLRPVDILNQEGKRLLGGDLSDELDPGVVEAVPRLDRMDPAREVEAERERKDLPLAEQREHALGTVAVQDAEVLLDDLCERLIGPCGSVRRTAAGAAQRVGRLCAAPLPQLAQQARLAYAGLAHDRDGLRLTCPPSTLVRLPEETELVVAADERRPQTGNSARAHEGEGADEPPALHATRLSFGFDVRRRVELERAGDQCRGPPADENLARLGGLLEPRGHVDRVSGDERALLASPADHDLPRVDPNPQRQRAAEELLQPTPHRESRVQRPLDVILQCRRNAERGHHRVADELLDGSARA